MFCKYSACSFIISITDLNNLLKMDLLKTYATVNLSDIN